MTYISDYQANQWLNELQSCWVALHVTDPSDGAITSEVNGGSYERVSVAFTEPSNRVIWNTTAVRFRGMPSCTVAYVAGWNVQYNGRMLWYAPLADDERVIAGKSFVIAKGEIAISFS